MQRRLLRRQRGSERPGKVLTHVGADSLSSFAQHEKRASRRKEPPGLTESRGHPLSPPGASVRGKDFSAPVSPPSRGRCPVFWPGATGPSSLWGPPFWAGGLTTPGPCGTEEAQSSRDLKSGEHSLLPSTGASGAFRGVLPAESHRREAVASPARAGPSWGPPGAPRGPSRGLALRQGCLPGAHSPKTWSHLTLGSARLLHVPGMSALPEPRRGPSEALPPLIPFSSRKGPVGWGML